MLKSHLGQTLIGPDQGRFAIHSMIDRAKGYILSDCHRKKLVVRVLEQEPGLVGGVVERWAERPVTKFERKGIAAGRPITDLCYRRRAG